MDLWSIRYLFCASILLFSTTGCATSTPVSEAPLEESRQQALRSSLTGTWQHVATKSNPEATPEPMEPTTITWTFREDGTGTFRQKIPSIDRHDTREFEWRLEGRNIVLSDKGQDNETYYRAESWSDQKMTWFNYTMSNYYVMEPKTN
jgi:hypothetical protein